MTTSPPVTDLHPSDRELLAQFSRHQEEAAFRQLIQRHGRMVLAVCSRILRDRHDAEDAFQATFLILACQAAKTNWSNSVGPWLCRVASQTAMNAARKRKPTFGYDASELAGHHAEEDLQPWLEISRREEQAALHEELDQLPDRYRSPLVLCYLEGLTRSQAATALECSEEVVKGRWLAVENCCDER